MRIPHGLRAALAAGSTPAPSGYQIARSLRFNSADSAYLSRTLGTPTNRNKWTFAFWLKPCFTSSSSVPTILGVDTSATSGVQFENTNQLRVGWSGGVLELSRVFRDFSAWYHVVISADVTNATTSSRLKIYVNGEDQESRYAIDNRSSLTASSIKINGSFLHYIGSNPAVSRTPDAYLADVHFIDGQALTPSSFAETDATTGAWIPKAYSGTYGTNGFKLDFADNSNNTATTLGKDTSGNGNNWTPNNLSVTAGAGNDSLVDSPTNYGTDTGAGGEVRGNYATWNPLQSTSAVLSNGNLDLTAGASTWSSGRSSLHVSSGKWYWEITVTTITFSVPYRIGIIPSSSYLGAIDSVSTAVGYANDGQKRVNGANASYGATYSGGDVIGVALDLDAGTIVFYKNGVSQGTAATGLSGFYCPALDVYTGETSGSTVANFGQRPFAYTAPSGFKALCTQNLPAPGVTKPSTAMDVKLYTGNGSTQTISGLGFSPDWVWLKSRFAAGSYHKLYDTVRGATKLLNGTNDTLAESTETQGLTAFNSDGFSLGTDANHNGNGGSFVAWCWDAGSSTVSSTSGSITSSVRANTSAGFSIVTYTGTGANATVGHGLGVAPKWVITKRRDNTGDWCVWVKEVYDSSNSSFLFLNATNASFSNAGVFNSSATTSTTFPVGTNAATNANGGTYVAYCFAPIAAFSAFGSYTGNGSSDGVFVHLNFQPAFLMLKRTDSTSNWTMVDAKREGYNVDNDPLYANLSDAEGTTDLVDLTSNGFKLRTTDTSVNASSGTYIYAAFAEQPFKTSRAR